jgi:phospholipid-binding lipoprotein MlaA
MPMGLMMLAAVALQVGAVPPQVDSMGSPVAPPPAAVAPQPPVAPPETSSPPPGQADDDDDGPPQADEHGTIVVSARQRAAIDPLEDVNEASFSLTTSVDRSVFGPVALAYAQTVPAPARDGLRNVLSNLNEPVSAINYLLQLKIGKALGTAARFTINSSLGAFGLFDVARAPGICLPRRPVGLAETLGFYGIGSGPYFYVPLVGPTSLRTAVGGFVDRLMLPTLIGGRLFSPYYVVPTAVLNGLNRRATNDARIRAVRESADPYTASRNAYLARRQARVDALRRAGHDDTTAYCAAWRAERAASKR